MYIRIDLKTTETESYRFPIAINDLEKALSTCYLGLGTPYSPIPIDGFVTIGIPKFPSIGSNTKIKVRVVSKNKGKKHNKQKLLLVCCKVRNVGKIFNNLNNVPKNYWGKIFDFKKKLIYSAPDGILYINPDRNNICHIATKKNTKTSYISYSIIFSLFLEDKEGYTRRYYFILDPLLDIRSRD